MPNTVLDCSSIDTAIDSLSGLLGLSVETLRRRLSEAAIDWDHSTVAPEDQLVQAFGYENKRDLPAPDGIRWFHATRAPVGATFKDGILPTRAALPKLWEVLWTVASQRTSLEEWRNFQLSVEEGDGQFARQWRRKRMDPHWEGPFAFLIRAAAIGDVGHNQDFSDVPETLKDICASYEEAYGHPLLAGYQAVTKPCLVVFTRPGNWHAAVYAALNYAHRVVNKLGHSIECNTNFAGRNQVVTASWIDRVEWL